MKVVRCLRRAGVGQEAVVGVWPACWGPPGDTVPNELLPVLCGSGFSFLKAPSEKKDDQVSLTIQSIP